MYLDHRRVGANGLAGLGSAGPGPIPIVGGLDIHRKQITFDYLDTETGQVQRGQITPADREHLRAWLARFAGRDDVAFAAEGCTGWRYVVEELAAAGIAAHLAEPADTAFARGRKRHAKTDKTDCRHLRMLLAEGRLPEKSTTGSGARLWPRAGNATNLIEIVRPAPLSRSSGTCNVPHRADRPCTVHDLSCGRLTVPVLPPQAATVRPTTRPIRGKRTWATRRLVTLIAHLRPSGQRERYACKRACRRAQRSRLLGQWSCVVSAGIRWPGPVKGPGVCPIVRGPVPYPADAGRR